jgi:hypothetical protein
MDTVSAFCSRCSADFKQVLSDVPAAFNAAIQARAKIPGEILSLAEKMGNNLDPIQANIVNNLKLFKSLQGGSK